MNKIFKKITILTLVLIFTISLIPITNVNAQEDDIASQMIGAVSGFDNLPGGGDDEGHIELVIGSIIQTFLSLFGIIFLALMIYGGYKWMMAKGNDEEVTKAKAIIRNAIIGLVIALLAYVITIFVVTYFYQASTTK